MAIGLVDPWKTKRIIIITTTPTITATTTTAAAAVNKVADWWQELHGSWGGTAAVEQSAGQTLEKQYITFERFKQLLKSFLFS